MAAVCPHMHKTSFCINFRWARRGHAHITSQRGGGGASDKTFVWSAIFFFVTKRGFKS